MVVVVVAIIFLAPISAFDQTLVEDKSVNRLVSPSPPLSSFLSIPASSSLINYTPLANTRSQEDSVTLWKSVCSNRLLEKVELILFMNKCDILDQKLRSGIRLAKYLRSFGDRPNDLENAQKCMYSWFPFLNLFFGFCAVLIFFFSGGLMNDLCSFQEQV